MVHVEKNNNQKNNSKVSSPILNGNSNSNDEDRDKIRVGKDYQAICPEYVKDGAKDLDNKAYHERSLLVWQPSDKNSDEQLNNYIKIAKEDYHYTGEQALGMLFWHKHDMAKALKDLANFTPYPDEWSAEDKVLFEQAFLFHGKTFHRIKQLLPDKSMGALVKYYYCWKKTRSKPKKNGSAKEESEPTSEQNSENENEDKDKMPSNDSNNERTENKVNGQKRKLKDDDSMKNAKWTKIEVSQVVEGIRKHGKNEKAISEFLQGTKTEAQIRHFFQTHKKKCNLEMLIKEREVDCNGDETEEKKQKLEIEETLEPSQEAENVVNNEVPK